MMRGRSLCVKDPPTWVEWEDALYHLPKEGKNRLNQQAPDNIIPHLQRAYAQALVATCLDAYWYDGGMPVIELGHKLAASLLLTSIPPDVLKTVKMPFPAFRINVPDGLLRFENGDVRHIKVGDHITPHQDDREHGDPQLGTAFVVRSEGGGSYSLGKDIGSLLSESFHESKDTTIPIPEGDLTKLPLVARLIGAVCLYMTGDPHDFPVKKVGKGHRWTGPCRAPGPPVVRTYRLTKEVVHNFTQAFKDYCDGDGSKLTVQCVVTGHWRNQACGKGMQDRKRIFIEPYWRGPEDAPIAVRPHKLKE